MKLVHYTLSYWTLRLSDAEMHQEFLNCQREEVDLTAKNALIV